MIVPKTFREMMAIIFDIFNDKCFASNRMRINCRGEDPRNLKIIFSNAFDFSEETISNEDYTLFAIVKGICEKNIITITIMRPEIKKMAVFDSNSYFIFIQSLKDSIRYGYRYRDDRYETESEDESESDYENPKLSVWNLFNNGIGWWKNKNEQEKSDI